MMQIPFKQLHPAIELPAYQTEGAAAMDLQAAVDDPIVLEPGERQVIPVGFAIELPQGFEAQIRSRSGLTIKQGLVIANGVGTIDSDYRGEVGAIVVNISDQPVTIEPLQRIAQMVIARYEQISWQPTEELSKTTRQEGAYGSTKH